MKLNPKKPKLMYNARQTKITWVIHGPRLPSLAIGLTHGLMASDGTNEHMMIAGDQRGPCMVQVSFLCLVLCILSSLSASSLYLGKNRQIKRNSAFSQANFSGTHEL